jgi:acyl transferase domain-containing protein
MGRSRFLVFSDEELESARPIPKIGGASPLLKAKAVLEDAEFFDAAFFGYSPEKLKLWTPHPYLLEVAWDARKCWL